MQGWPEGSWCEVGDYIRVPKWGGDRWEGLHLFRGDLCGISAGAIFGVGRGQGQGFHHPGDPRAFEDRAVYAVECFVLKGVKELRDHGIRRSKLGTVDLFAACLKRRHALPLGRRKDTLSA